MKVWKRKGVLRSVRVASGGVLSSRFSVRSSRFSVRPASAKVGVAELRFVTDRTAGGRLSLHERCDGVGESSGAERGEEVYCLIADPALALRGRAEQAVEKHTGKSRG